jgi:RNA polymerase sigma-70 factor (ECF subfamily)
VTSGADGVQSLYEASYPRLVGVLALAAGDRAEAEEVVQEAFVRLLGRWSTVSAYDDPEAWVRRVAFRLLSNRWRKRATGCGPSVRLGPPPVVAGPTADRLDVARALAELPIAQRQVVVLHHLVGLDLAAVAAELDVPVGTVKSRLSRARAALAPLLREESSRA